MGVAAEYNLFPTFQLSKLRPSTNPEMVVMFRACFTIQCTRQKATSPILKKDTVNPRSCYVRAPLTRSLFSSQFLVPNAWRPEQSAWQVGGGGEETPTVIT